jgi:hypothetical protein
MMDNSTIQCDQCQNLAQFVYTFASDNAPHYACEHCKETLPNDIACYYLVSSTSMELIRETFKNIVDVYLMLEETPREFLQVNIKANSQ